MSEQIAQVCLALNSLAPDTIEPLSDTKMAAKAIVKSPKRAMSVSIFGEKTTLKYATKMKNKPVLYSWIAQEIFHSISRLSWANKNGKSIFKLDQEGLERSGQIGNSKPEQIAKSHWVEGSR